MTLHTGPAINVHSRLRAQGDLGSDWPESAGHDDVPVMVIKSVIGKIVHILVFLFNLSLSTGIFPDVLKTSKVIPLHKRGSKSSVSNFRPISLLSIFSKILEKIIHRRIMRYLTENNLLSPAQHGFVKGKSTHSALNQVMKTVVRNVDRGKCQ